MEILTDESKKERENWLKARIKLAESQNVIQCKYCGVYSGIYRITLKKFILPKSKQKVYLCNRHWNKANELDNIIWFMNSKEYEDLNKTLEKKKKEDELKALRKKIVIISILSILLLSILIFILWR